MSDVDRFQVRVVQDAITEASSLYWLRRARTFEAAAPRPRDRAGQASEVELDQAARQCVATASACRARATNRHLLTDDEQQIAAYVLTWLPAPTEPVESLIARHRRVLAAVDELAARGAAA